MKERFTSVKVSALVLTVLGLILSGRLGAREAQGLSQ